MAQLDCWPKITLFGDSITRLSMDPQNGNWASYLAHELADYYQVDVKGFSGYTSKLAASLAKQLFTERYLKNVHLFVIFFGHNDAWQSPGFPAVSTQEYEIYMQEILDWLLSNGLARRDIIIITPGWYDRPTFTDFPPKEIDHWKTFDHSARYAQLAGQIAAKNNITSVDWWKATLELKPFEKLFCDGLHLSQFGAKCLFELIWPTVKAKIESKHNKPVNELAMVVTPKELIEAGRRSNLDN